MPTALLSSLTVHPAAAALPMPAATDPDSQVIVASIVELGRILDPLKVCKGRIVDGRIRQRGALAAGLVEVPVEEVEESEVTSIILHSLAARRHLTKSALAYIGFPVMETALAESRARRLANLKSGVSASKPRSSTGKTIGNAAELAELLGVSRSLFFTAQEIHKKFNSSPKSIRAMWEPKILSGEMGLPQVQQAIAGKLAALNGSTTPKGDAQQLLLELFSSAKVRFGRWDKLQPAQRAAATAQFRAEFLPSLPPELLDEAERFLSTRLATA
jgi:hypothetical protein